MIQGSWFLWVSRAPWLDTEFVYFVITFVVIIIIPVNDDFETKLYL